MCRTEDETIARCRNPSRDWLTGPAAAASNLYSASTSGVLLVLEQCEDRLGLKVVIRNLLPYIARLVCLVEGHRHSIGQANTLKPDHQRPRRQCKAVRDGSGSGANPSSAADRSAA